jgi:hypothetical protein
MTAKGFGLVIGFIEYLQNATTDKYDYLELHTSSINVKVFTSRCLVATFNGPLSPPCGFPNFSRLQLSASNFSLMKLTTCYFSLHKPGAYSTESVSSNIACSLFGRETFPQSCYLRTAVILQTTYTAVTLQ